METLARRQPRHRQGAASGWSSSTSTCPTARQAWRVSPQTTGPCRPPASSAPALAVANCVSPTPVTRSATGPGSSLASTCAVTAATSSRYLPSTPPVPGTARRGGSPPRQRPTGCWSCWTAPAPPMSPRPRRLPSCRLAPASNATPPRRFTERSPEWPLRSRAAERLAQPRRVQPRPARRKRAPPPRRHRRAARTGSGQHRTSDRRGAPHDHLRPERWSHPAPDGARRLAGRSSTLMPSIAPAGTRSLRLRDLAPGGTTCRCLPMVAAAPCGCSAEAPAASPGAPRSVGTAAPAHPLSSCEPDDEAEVLKLAFLYG